jgi:dephospho-CoA kinase
MSSWPGKYVIGLTGNIATGKSVVRKMLEHLGAYGIDADALSHRAIIQGAPGYQPVIDHFGKWLVGADGQIDRTRLGKVVFSDSEALSKLEGIVHPLVGQAVDIFVRRSTQKVIVVEAIKLIESGLRQRCDSLWVTYAPRNVQMNRLMQKRNMPQALALQRIDAQPPQEEKLAVANVIIRNDTTYESTWRQVQAAWNQLFPSTLLEPELAPAVQVQTRIGRLEVVRARPRQSVEIAALINQFSAGQRSITGDDIMAAFGEKAFLIIKLEGVPVGVVGWKVENLVACTDDVYFASQAPVVEALSLVMEEVERASRELQSEVSLLFLPARMADKERIHAHTGYQPRLPDQLGVRVWEEAARETMPNNSVLLFKQLRQDRVLKPF